MPIDDDAFGQVVKLSKNTSVGFIDSVGYEADGGQVIWLMMQSAGDSMR